MGMGRLGLGAVAALFGGGYYFSGTNDFEVVVHRPQAEVYSAFSGMRTFSAGGLQQAGIATAGIRTSRPSANELVFTSGPDGGEMLDADRLHFRAGRRRPGHARARRDRRAAGGIRDRRRGHAAVGSQGRERDRGIGGENGRADGHGPLVRRSRRRGSTSRSTSSRWPASPTSSPLPRRRSSGRRPSTARSSARLARDGW